MCYDSWAWLGETKASITRRELMKQISAMDANMTAQHRRLAEVAVIQQRPVHSLQHLGTSAFSYTGYLTKGPCVALK